MVGKRSSPVVGSVNANKSSWITSLSLLLFLTLWTRLHKIDQPPWVCWDETHFGKMGSWYINRTFFFDVHPPLGKMIIGGVGWLTGYNGTFPFEKPGDLYLDHNYLGMRLVCTFMGACIVPFSFFTVWELTHSLTASIISGLLVVFDIGMLTLNQYILLDPILLFYISGATASMARFKSINSIDGLSFTASWWFWLTLTGINLGGAISVKFVGLFVILLVGLTTLQQLWDVLGDLSRPFTYTLKHLASRIICLIVLPIFIYISLFYIHLSVLYKSGTGDGHFSSSFQSSLNGNALFNASMPLHLAYGSVITLKNHRTGGGYLHSHFHLYPDGVGAKQQQITSYAHKDENNKFLVKKWDVEPHQDETSNNTVEFVYHGDLVRLEHIPTRRNIHSHKESAYISKKQYQVTGYGENGTGDANDVWRIEIVNGQEGEIVKTISSKIKFHHYFLACVLTSGGKQLPKWAYEQQEISCNPTHRDPNSIWNVEENYFLKLKNVSLGNFAPKFFSRFFESHAVMFQGNAGLKPKEGEYTSRPWEWPILMRGQWFSGGQNQRIYLLGNPIIWWGNIIFLLIFLLSYCWARIVRQRTNTAEEIHQHLRSCAWLYLGWLLHYVPFWAMGRVLYFHHYFPALIFSSMITAIIIDLSLSIVSKRLSDYGIGETGVKSFYHTIIGGLIAILWYSFYVFSPLAYGMDETPASLPNSTMHNLKWLSSWEF